MDSKNCTRAAGDCFGHSLRIEIVRGWIDVDENRRRATITNTISRCYKRMACSYYLIASFHPYGQQREMKCRRAIGDCAGVRRTHKRRRTLVQKLQPAALAIPSPKARLGRPPPRLSSREPALLSESRDSRLLFHAARDSAFLGAPPFYKFGQSVFERNTGLKT